MKYKIVIASSPGAGSNDEQHSRTQPLLPRLNASEDVEVAGADTVMVGEHSIHDIVQHLEKLLGKSKATVLLPTRPSDGSDREPSVTIVLETDRQISEEPFTAGENFCSTDIRHWSQPRKLDCRHFSYPESFHEPPRILVGLRYLDFSSRRNLRVKTWADEVTNDMVRVNVSTWEDSTMYAAGSSWLAIRARDPDFQYGRFSTEEDHPWHEFKHATQKEVTFDRPYLAPPAIALWFDQLDSECSRNHRSRAFTSNITPLGFTINIESWDDSVLYSAGVSWLSYPAAKPGVESGTFSVRGTENNTVRAKFTKFRSKPKQVFLGLSHLDTGCGRNIRVRLGHEALTGQGMACRLETWGDTILHAASGTYIVIGE